MLERDINKMKGLIGLQSVFFRNYSTYEGTGARLYRSCAEIRKDIKQIKSSIEEAYAMLNIRNLLAEAIAEYAASEPEVWIPELKQIIEDADDTLTRLTDLRENLDILKSELEDTKWVLGI